MKKKIVFVIFAVLLAAALSVTLAACNSDSAQKNPPEPEKVYHTVTLIFDDFTTTVQVEDGTPLDVDEIDVPDGYKVGDLWTTRFKNKPYDVTTLVTEDVTLYADIIKLYTVTFRDRDGKVLKTETVEEGGDATAPVVPTVEGYGFDGWNGEYTSVFSDITLTAIYSPESYTVTFDADGGETSYSPIYVFYGDSVPVPAVPEKEGFVFVYWYDATTDGSEPYDFGAAMQASDLTLKAHWTVCFEVAPYVGAFDGTDHAAIALSVFGAERFDVEYAVGDGEWQTAVPVVNEVGEYTVRYRISCDGATVREGEAVSVVSQPADGSAKLTVTALPQSTVYNGLPQTPSSSAAFYTFEGLAAGHTATAYSSFTATNAGEYDYACTTVVVRDAHGNYVTGAYTLDAVKSTFTVEKATANVSAPTVYVDWDENVHYYTEEYVTVAEPYNNQEIVIAGNGCATGGVYSFTVVLGGNENWNEQVLTGKLAIKSVRIGDETYTLEDALKTGGTIVLFGDTVLSSSATLRLGSTLVLPSSQDSSYTVAAPTYGAGVEKHVDTDGQYLEYTLTVEENAIFDVYGDIIVCGLLGQTGQGISGHTSGMHSVLVNNGTINLLGGSNLDIRGYVKGGGLIDAQSGSVIYAPFVVYDFRGGSNTYSAFMQGKISPFNVYDMFYNIQCSLDVSSGAEYISYLDLYTSKPKQHNTSQARLIGGYNAFLITGGNGAVKVRFSENDEYAGTVGNSEVTITGDVEFGNLSLKITMLIFTITCNLSDVDIPLSLRNDFVIGDGVTPTAVTMKYDYKLLTGTSFTVAENAKLTITGSLIVYSEFIDTPMANVGYPEAEAAEFVVNGTLELGDGASFGGRIQSATAGAKVAIGEDVTLNYTTKEGHCCSLRYPSTVFYTVFEITEEARFDEGELALSTDTPKTSSNNIAYTERIREYAALQPLSAGTTYVYDGTAWTAQ